MKNIPLVIFGLAMTALGFSPLHAQITVFTYQGLLDLNGAPANGRYDFMFRLMSDPTNGVAVPVIPINLAVPVTNGLFTTGMDFGAENFDGANRWLEINVRTNGSGPFSTLSPRQLLTPTPYAIMANTASNLLGALPAGQISGTIPDASLPANPSFSGTVTANNFSGDGANVTSVNAATLGGLNSSSFWRTTGNAGTTAGTHFLGTTDDQPLEIQVNKVRILRLEPDSTGSGAPNIIGGAPVNSVDSGVFGATISGGGVAFFGVPRTNRVGANFGTIGGGSGNTIHAGSGSATIAGGQANTVHSNAAYSIIGGGQYNDIAPNSWYTTIVGGVQNEIGEESDLSAIIGGANNKIAAGAYSSSIGGGDANDVGTNSSYGVIGGGAGSHIAANSPYSTISGGSANNIGGNSMNSTISGGDGNGISYNSDRSTVNGGAFNRIGAASSFSIIGGGYGNVVLDNSIYATILGGVFNTATNYAFVAGRRAYGVHTGAFVWGDSTDAYIASTSANSVTMRASGGYRFFTDSTATTGAFLAAGSGSWTSMSDRNAKENFRAADARAVLENVVALPLQTWNYKSQDSGIRHIGPMAQDFKAAFNVGESDTGISTVDADGVALAAIQGLNLKLEETRSENAKLKQRLAELERLVGKLAIAAQP